MRAVELSDDRLQELVAYSGELTFALKSNRDRAYKMIPQDDRSNWKKSSMRNQLLDAHYVSDAEDTTDYGIGNDIQSWDVLYNLDRRRW